MARKQILALRRIAVATFLMIDASAAKAAVLTTSLVYGAHNLACNIVNAGKKPVDVTISIVKADGTVYTSISPTIAPGAANGLGTGSPFGQFAYCRFDVKGSKLGVRASLESYALDGTTIAELPAE